LEKGEIAGLISDLKKLASAQQEDDYLDKLSTALAIYVTKYPEALQKEAGRGGRIYRGAAAAGRMIGSIPGGILGGAAGAFQWMGAGARRFAARGERLKSQAQAAAAQTSIDFIRNIGLQENADGQTEAITVSFLYQSAEGVTQSLTVPILAIVPLPFIQDDY